MCVTKQIHVVGIQKRQPFYFYKKKETSIFNIFYIFFNYNNNIIHQELFINSFQNSLTEII